MKNLSNPIFQRNLSSCGRLIFFPKPANFQSFKMKHIGSIYLAIFFLFVAQVAWGQTDSTKLTTTADSLKYRTVVSDRISEPDEPERAPSLSKMLKKADDAYAKKNFFAAMKYYEFVLKAEPMHIEALKGQGESAMEITSLDIAEKAFQRLVDHGLSPSPDYFPKMRLAEVKFRKGKYPEAAELYLDIATQPQTPPVTAEVQKKAAVQYELCLWAQGAGLDNPYIVKNDTCFLLDTANVNTKELYSEYVAAIRDGQLYFSAYRFDFKKDKSNPKRNTIKVLKAENADGMVGPDHKMNVSEAPFNDLKRQHTAHLSFNQAGDAVYYSLGDYVGDSANIRFELYRRKMQADSIWGIPEKLKGVNLPGYTSTEPSVGTISYDENETLFFVSDRPGGKGGRDIWYSTILGDSLSAPMPLSAINTPGEDVTPFYHTPSNTLFFSSDSLPSLGGFDVYKTKPQEPGQWSKPAHMGSPINGSANDVFFTMDKESHRGFFSSNRIGGTNYSEEGCCYDIFAVDFLTRYKVIALHEMTRASLPYTRVSLYEKAKDGTMNLVSAPPAELQSVYSFAIKLNTEYLLIGEKQGYQSDTLRRITPEELFTVEIVDTLYLRPEIYLVTKVFDCQKNIPVYGATAKLVDLGYRNDAGKFITTTNKIQSTVLAETTNRQEYKIPFGHQFRVIMQKEGYLRPDTSDLISTIGLTESDTLEVKLYLERPDPLVNYLPIPLYFDNDEPRIRATDTVPMIRDATDPYLLYVKNALIKNRKDPEFYDTIFVDYQKTFVNYIRTKDTEFLPGYLKGIKGEARKRDSLDMDNFFEMEVRANWDKFFEFSDSLNAMLDRGDSIEITLKGYASPLADSAYNHHLTNRRIESVYNHFQIFDGGVFQRYYKPDNTGSLKILREPNGDSQAPKDISDSTKDLRKSIYDIRASRERRVEIVGVRVRKGLCD